MENNRYFDKTRAFRLTKWVINILTLLLLILSIYCFVLSANFKNSYNNCIKNDLTRNIEGLCNHYYENKVSTNNKGQQWLILSFLLPSIFYGGVKIYNYVYPKDNQEIQ